MRTVSVKERDALLNELHNLAGSFRSKHDKLHEQVNTPCQQFQLAPCVQCQHAKADMGLVVFYVSMYTHQGSSMQQLPVTSTAAIECSPVQQSSKWVATWCG